MSLKIRYLLLPWGILWPLLIAFHRPEQPQNRYRSMEVTATAFHATEAQIQEKDLLIAAWGDTLAPGVSAIAVSPDLIQEGLDHNTPVRIRGLPGVYHVLDKMSRREKNHIDIYMGSDEEKAQQWGEQTVEIMWYVE